MRNFKLHTQVIRKITVIFRELARTNEKIL